MSVPTIANLQNLISNYVGNNKKIIDTKLELLTAPGENYLGVLLKLEAILLNEKTGIKEEFNAVAKCIDLKNVQSVLKNVVPQQFRKECTFYIEIVPVLQQFVNKFNEKFDLVPKLYGARYNLKNDNNCDEVDENAVMLMENLHCSGYKNADRTVGYDMETAKVVLKDLALFHAAPLALKLKSPEVFKEKIKKHLNFLPIDFKEISQPNANKNSIPFQAWFDILNEYDDIKQYTDALKLKLSTSIEDYKNFSTKPAREPFATIFHMDMWTNNTLQIYNEKGVAIKNKFIDFQFYCYESPLADLLFLLWSSVQLPIILEHFDHLILFYKEQFLSYLSKFECDIEQFDKQFNDELNYAGKCFTVLPKFLVMIATIYAKKGQPLFEPNEGPMNVKKENITEAARQRFVAILKEWGRREWI